MNDNSLLIDDYTLSVLHFDDPNEPIKDECGKIEWKSNYFNLTDKDMLKPNGKFGNCIDLSGKSVFTVPPEIYDSKPRTIDFWFNLKDHNYTIFFCMGSGGTSTNHDFGIYQPSKNVLGIIHCNDNPKVNISPIELNIWHHIALVYDGTYEYIFFDGRMIFKNQRILYTSGRILAINAQAPDTVESESKVLYDEFRISNVARWTEDFIPPNYPYYKYNKIFLDKPNFIYGITNKV